MDLRPTHVALLALLLGLVLRQAARVLSAYRFQSRTGARPAPRLPSAGFLGRRFVAEDMRAAAEGGVLELHRRRFAAMGAANKTFRTSALGMSFHFTADVDNVKAALTDTASWGVAGRGGPGGWSPLLVRGIFMAEGPEWEHSRGLVRPAVARGELSQLAKVEVHVAALVRRLAEARGATVDLQRLFYGMTLDSAQDFLLGVGTAGAAAAGGEAAAARAAFERAVDRALEAVFFRMRTPTWLRWALLWKTNRRFERDAETVHAYIDRMVARQAAKAEAAAAEAEAGAGAGADKGYVFADELLRATGGDREQVRWELLSILAAARDTTAQLLSAVFHALARHPRVWAELQDEVAGLRGRKPGYDELKSMKYLRYVLNETLRLFPVVANNGRWANRDTVLPRGGGPDGTAPCFVPEGSFVVLAMHVLHRQEAVFGPDAAEFRPERWADPKLRPGWNFIPFGGGRRVCPGQQFALVEAGYTVVRLLQEFPLIENRDPRPYAAKIRISVSCLHGVLVGLKKEE